jgi:3-dehydrosphinganine reductase
VAHRLGKLGATLALLDRNAEALEKVAAEVASLGGKALLETVDVTDAAATREAVHRLWEAAGPIDVSFQSAGILRLGSMERHTIDDFRALMDVNLFGTLHVIQAILPLMRQRGRGHLINMGSVAGLRGLPYMPGYSASKFAVVGLSQALRSELEGTGITVSVVCPPSIRTPMVTSQPELPAIYRRFPWLTPEQVAEVVVQAMDRPRFLVTVDLNSRLLLLLNRLLPGLVDRLVVSWSN